MPQTQGRHPGAAKAARTKSGAANRSAPTAKAALSNIADTLGKAAIDSYRAHHRYAELVDRGAPDAEQRTARSAVKRSDEILDEAVDLYELACLEDSNHGEDTWWHRANMVWRAAKEYLKHHASSNRLTRGGGDDHSRADLMELGVEYELEASALLRLRHEVESYESSRLKTSQTA